MGNVCFMTNNDYHLIENDLPKTELRKFGDNCEVLNVIVTDVGLAKDFNIPELFKEESWFGKLPFLAVDRGVFTNDDQKVIENRLGRKLDGNDNICIRNPSFIKDGQLLPQHVFVVRVYDSQTVR